MRANFNVQRRVKRGEKEGGCAKRRRRPRRTFHFPHSARILLWLSLMLRDLRGPELTEDRDQLTAAEQINGGNHQYKRARKIRTWTIAAPVPTTRMPRA